MREACGSCGRDGEELETVQRVYLDAPSSGDAVDGDDTAPGFTLTDDIERWCPTCRLTFPHVPVPST